MRRYGTLITLVFVAIGMSIAAGQTVEASNSTARLQITPTVCVIDVIQDGSNQTIQTPSGDCTVELPMLLNPTASAAREGGLPFALPFAGAESGAQRLFRSQPGGTLTTIAAKHPEASPTTRADVEQSAMLVAGLAVTGTAVIVGIDMALFDLHYSKIVARWTHSQTAGRLLKK